MNKLILGISILLLFVGCEPKPFRGFLVCKEYIKGHMDDEQSYIRQEATMFVPIHRPMTHGPKYVHSVWYFYVANKNSVRRFSVDSLTYTKHKVGERIVIN